MQHKKASRHGFRDEPIITYRLMPFNEVAVRTERRYLVKGLIPKVGLTIVWGPPKSGKSFFATDLAMHVALGWDYRGRRVQQGTVVYLACEGQDGFQDRLAAFRGRCLGDSFEGEVPFYLLPYRLSLVKDGERMVRDVRGQLGPNVPAVVVIDTLNRSMDGSESNDEDMTAYVNAADAIQKAFGCAVVVVHHCGIEGSRPRGHTSLTGAADAQIAVKKVAEGQFSAVLELAKDMAAGDEVHGRLEAVCIGIDEDGDEITSCVVVEADEASRPSKAPRLSARERQAMEVLKNCIADQGRASPGAPHYPDGVPVIGVDQFKDYLFKAGVLDKAAANPRSDWKRLLDRLQDKTQVRVWSGLAWMVSHEAA